MEEEKFVRLSSVRVRRPVLLRLHDEVLNKSRSKRGGGGARGAATERALGESSVAEKIRCKAARFFRVLYYIHADTAGERLSLIEEARGGRAAGAWRGREEKKMIGEAEIEIKIKGGRARGPGV